MENYRVQIVMENDKINFSESIIKNKKLLGIEPDNTTFLLNGLQEKKNINKWRKELIKIPTDVMKGFFDFFAQAVNINDDINKDIITKFNEISNESLDNNELTNIFYIIKYIIVEYFQIINRVIAIEPQAINNEANNNIKILNYHIEKIDKKVEQTNQGINKDILRIKVLFNNKYSDLYDFDLINELADYLFDKLNQNYIKRLYFIKSILNKKLNQNESEYFSSKIVINKINKVKEEQEMHLIKRK